RRDGQRWRRRHRNRRHELHEPAGRGLGTRRRDPRASKRLTAGRGRGGAKPRRARCLGGRPKTPRRGRVSAPRRAGIVREGAGARGGKPGGMARSVIHRADGSIEAIPSKTVTLLRRSDRVVIETAGGGGFGDPLTRDRELVAADIANGKVSETAGQEQYGF